MTMRLCLTANNARVSCVPMADRHKSNDGTLIFCGISLALLVVALWAAASGHADMSAVMF